MAKDPHKEPAEADEGVHTDGATAHVAPEEPDGATAHAEPDGATEHATPNGATAHATPDGATAHSTSGKSQ